MSILSKYNTFIEELSYNNIIQYISLEAVQSVIYDKIVWNIYYFRDFSFSKFPIYNHQLKGLILAKLYISD